MAFWSWSKTAASNATADATVNWAEGQSPSSVNDSARAMMARIAEHRDDVSGGLSTAGTSTAYTVTTNQVFDSFAHMHAQELTILMHATNGAAPTLNVDGLGAKAIHSAIGTPVTAGMLIASAPYKVVYSSPNNCFVVFNIPGDLAFGVPIGGVIPYLGSSAPNSNFVLPFGQAISRATYATLFALTSTTFGVGDGSTTFNVPDLRDLAIFGLGNMGGSDRGLITNAVSGITGTTIGATGGAQSVTLARSALPNVALTVTGTTQPKVSGVAMIAPTSGAIASGFGAGVLPTYGQGTFGVADNTALDNGATASINGAVTQTAVNEMPPAMILPYILRVL